jgi:pimeloyl-ACP methyl ester carboxylesterase
MLPMLAMLGTLVAVPHASYVTHAKVHRAGPVSTYTGTFEDGATYLIQAPSNWNGTLALYSHGYTPVGDPNPAYDVGDGLTGQYLLAQGYALAGSSYATNGWAVQQAIPDQMEVLSTFASLVGTPARTIAWGHSLGGLVTAGLIQQYPASFDAALPMCGAVGGGVGFWNSYLDFAYAINTLLAADELQVVNITDPSTNWDQAMTIVEAAQNTPQGQARIALAAALSDIPGWYTTGSPRPAKADYADEEANQYQWLVQDAIDFAFFWRAELEARAGGNPSWNAGVDYRGHLDKSPERAEVRALYAQAGLSLNADLRSLAARAKITANPASLNYLSDNIILDGQISVPVLALQTEGDGLVVPESETAYGGAVNGSGDGALLRRLYVNRAGHCAFTSAETIVAFETLVGRLNQGSWGGLKPGPLNVSASALGPSYNAYPPAYADFNPGPYLRTYNGVPPVSSRVRR